MLLITPYGHVTDERMMTNLKAWLKRKFSAADTTPPPSLQNTGTFRQRLAASETPDQQAKPDTAAPRVDIDPHVHGTVESLGPGKNVYVQSPYVREDLGTHESLKIVDDSLIDGEEPDGLDPYNTGRFDKSRKWDQRFRK